MLLFDMMVQVTVGGVFALRDREELAQPASKPADSKAFRDGLLYSMLLYVPSAVFFLAAWPAWNSMYLLDIETRPMWAAWYALARWRSVWTPISPSSTNVARRRTCRK